MDDSASVYDYASDLSSIMKCLLPSHGQRKRLSAAAQAFLDFLLDQEAARMLPS